MILFYSTVSSLKNGSIKPLLARFRIFQAFFRFFYFPHSTCQITVIVRRANGISAVTVTATATQTVVSTGFEVITAATVKCREQGAITAADTAAPTARST